MKIFGIQIGGSNNDNVEETSVLKTEHYPVDEVGADEEAIMQRVQNVRVCDRCAAVYYGVHSCRW